MKALLSIKPEFVDEIISGNKKFEYRKRIFKEQVEAVVIYSSMPVGKIIGEFTIKEILLESPENIWNETKKYSGISEEFFFKYFKEKDKAYAIEIKDLLLYDVPINPYNECDNFVPPQSFKYIHEAIA